MCTSQYGRSNAMHTTSIFSCPHSVGLSPEVVIAQSYISTILGYT